MISNGFVIKRDQVAMLANFPDEDLGPILVAAFKRCVGSDLDGQTVEGLSRMSRAIVDGIVAQATEFDAAMNAKREAAKERQRKSRNGKGSHAQSRAVTRSHEQKEGKKERKKEGIAPCGATGARTCEDVPEVRSPMTLAQVLEVSRMIGGRVAGQEELVREWYANRTAAGWLDSDGRAITSARIRPMLVGLFAKEARVQRSRPAAQESGCGASGFVAPIDTAAFLSGED